MAATYGAAVFDLPKPLFDLLRDELDYVEARHEIMMRKPQAPLSVDGYKRLMENYLQNEAEADRLAAEYALEMTRK